VLLILIEALQWFVAHPLNKGIARHLMLLRDAPLPAVTLLELRILKLFPAGLFVLKGLDSGRVERNWLAGVLHVPQWQR